MPTATRIHRIALQNYKSFAHCDVALESLTFVVGANGSGKSNFLDALRFVAEALRISLDYAIQERNGFDQVRRRSSGPAQPLGIRLDLTLRSGQSGFYAFEINGPRDGGFSIQREECNLGAVDPKAPPATFCVEEGQPRWSLASAPPAASKDRLYLVNASGLPEFRPLYDALSGMAFYNLVPDRIRDLRAPDAGDFLARDGGNLASVLAALEKRSPMAKKRIEEYMALLVDGFIAVKARRIGQRVALEFRQTAADSKRPRVFLANSMSDGTLRALGILVALFQNGYGPSPSSNVTLVGIEEPEMALHPAAAELLRDALRDASERSQVLVTSHSPDLLDDSSIEPEMIRAVVAELGESRIGHLDEVGRAALHDSLFTPGELLRLKQLLPAPDEAHKLNLFAPLLVG